MDLNDWLHEDKGRQQFYIKQSATNDDMMSFVLVTFLMEFYFFLYLQAGDAIADSFSAFGCEQ